jgi:prolyl oligopeptidase
VSKAIKKIIFKWVVSLWKRYNKKMLYHYPKTKEANVREKIHGTTVFDPYRWLEGDTAEVKRWARTQDRFAHSVLDRLPQRDRFEKFLCRLMKDGSLGVPYPKNGYYFTMDRSSQQDLAVLSVRRGLRGRKRILIDQNKLSQEGTTTLRQWTPSEDASLLVYALSESGNDQNGIFVLDVRTGKKLKDNIPAKYYPAMYNGVSWNPNNSGFWYSRRGGRAVRGEEKLNQKVFYHRIGEDYRKDKLVFGKNLPKDQFPSVLISPDGNYLLVSVTIVNGKTRRNELYLKDLRADIDFRPVVQGIQAEFDPQMHRDMLYCSTNYQASNWRVIGVSLKEAARGIRRWKTIIPAARFPHDYVSFIKDRIFLRYIENAHSLIRIFDLRGKLKETLDLPLGSTGWVLGEEEGDEAFFFLTSYTVPRRIYRYDLKQSRLHLIGEKKVPGVNADRFVTEQVWYRSKDGTKIPMFLVHKKGLRQTGDQPTLLYGYGGFNISMLPGYGSSIMAFLEAGGLYAEPNLRGGGEFGEKWHEAGTKAKKQNVFDDFIAAAEWLIKNKYTDAHHLAAFGWSNGGLLAGAMITQRPDLFRVVVAGAPVTDMLRYHKFNGGRFWIPDYGDPDDPRAPRYLLKYSPYHNIKDGVRYPAILILTAEEDDRVHPSHAYKFAARLQKENVSDNPILLTVERKAGHGGAASVSNFVRQRSDIYGFILWRLGMK